MTNWIQTSRMKSPGCRPASLAELLSSTCSIYCSPGSCRDGTNSSDDPLYIDTSPRQTCRPTCVQKGDKCPAHVMYKRRYNFITMRCIQLAKSALTLRVGHQEQHLACKNWLRRCWCSYLPAARSRLFANGPADADATAFQNPNISCLI